MKSSLYGIEPLKFYLAKKSTQQLLTCGQLAASSSKWHINDLFSMEIQKSDRSSKSSRSLVHQQKTLGKELEICRSSSSLSLNGK